MTELDVTSLPSSSSAGTKVRGRYLGWRLCVFLFVCAPARHVHPLHNTFCSLAVTSCKSNTSSITTHSRFLGVLVSLSCPLFHPESSPIWHQSLPFYKYVVCLLFIIRIISAVQKKVQINIILSENYYIKNTTETLYFSSIFHLWHFVFVAS